MFLIPLSTLGAVTPHLRRRLQRALTFRRCIGTLEAYRKATNSTVLTSPNAGAGPVYSDSHRLPLSHIRHDSAAAAFVCTPPCLLKVSFIFQFPSSLLTDLYTVLSLGLGQQMGGGFYVLEVGRV